MPHPPNEAHAYLTDSGRSSLRLLLRSGFSTRRFLLPDFLCQIIPAVLDQEGVDYDFYPVREDLSIDATGFDPGPRDVLYVVDYFGQRTDYTGLTPIDGWIVQDSVFSPVVRRPAPGERWIGFNSLRKISSLADGSIVHSSVPLKRELILGAPAPFVDVKWAAKRRKWAFIHAGIGEETAYLSEFERGEDQIDVQRDVHAMSDASLHGLLEYLATLEEERRVRQRNYALLDARLAAFNLPVVADYPSLYVLAVPRRNELRDYLRTRSIYLPVHWPNPRGLGNPLYDRVISVPVDSRFDEADMGRVADAVLAFMKHG